MHSLTFGDGFLFGCLFASGCWMFFGVVALLLYIRED